MTADVCAAGVFDAVLNNEKDVMLCDMQARVACWLRFVCPSLYFWIMEKRALKLGKEE